MVLGPGLERPAPGRGVGPHLPRAGVGELLAQQPADVGLAGGGADEASEGGHGHTAQALGQGDLAGRHAVGDPGPASRAAEVVEAAADPGVVGAGAHHPQGHERQDGGPGGEPSPVALLRGVEPGLGAAHRPAGQRPARELARHLDRTVERLQEIAGEPGSRQAGGDERVVGALQQELARVGQLEARRGPGDEVVGGQDPAGPRREPRRRGPCRRGQEEQLAGDRREIRPRDLPAHRQPQAHAEARALGAAESMDHPHGPDHRLALAIVAGLGARPPAEHRERQIGLALGIEPGSALVLAAAHEREQTVALGRLQIVEQAIGEQHLARGPDVGHPHEPADAGVGAAIGARRARGIGGLAGSGRRQGPVAPGGGDPTGADQRLLERAADDPGVGDRARLVGAPGGDSDRGVGGIEHGPRAEQEKPSRGNLRESRAGYPSMGDLAQEVSLRIL